MGLSASSAVGACGKYIPDWYSYSARSGKYYNLYDSGNFDLASLVCDEDGASLAMAKTNGDKLAIDYFFSRKVFVTQPTVCYVLNYSKSMLSRHKQ